MLKIYFDDDSGELCEVRENEPFAKEDLMLRTDVLRDTLYYIADMYNDAVEAYVGSIRWPEKTPEHCKDQYLNSAQMLRAKVVMREGRAEDTIFPPLLEKRKKAEEDWRN